MKLANELYFFLIVIAIYSCGPDCVTCNRGEQDRIELCDDPDISYTTIDGAVATYDEAVETAIRDGYECR